MSQIRRLKQKLKKEHNVKIKRQKTIFSLCVVFTIVVSFAMLLVCAINDAPMLTTTIISGCVWLLFDIVFASALKNKWYILYDACPTSRLSYQVKTETQRKKDNWEGNCFWFVICVTVFLIHVVLCFVLL